MSTSCDKENRPKTATKNAKSAATRQALSELCENILPSGQNGICTIKKAETKIRSTSASEVETTVKFTYLKENITERPNGEFASDEVFIEGEYHFINFLNGGKSAGIPRKPKSEELENQITQTLPVIRVTAPTTERKLEMKKPQKITLARKLSNRHSKKPSLEELLQNCMYNKEYFEINFRYMLDSEGKYVYRKQCLKKNIDESYRLVVVNWLVYAQQVLDLSESTFFVAVRMFDFVLATIAIPGSKYILVAITCLWIANKQFDVHLIQTPKLFSLCNGKYSKQQINSMERKILRLLKFNVNFPEPFTFLFYFSKLVDIETNQFQQLFYSGLFLLESFTLLLDFSSMCPSVLAAIALYLSLLKYDINPNSLLHFIEKNCVGTDTFVRKSQQMALCVKHILNEKSFKNEIFLKYSTELKFNVAQKFLVE